MKNTADGFDPVVAPPEMVPATDFFAILEDLHRAIGCATGITAPTRHLLLGMIEGHRATHGYGEPAGSRREAVELTYALRRAVGVSEMTTLSVDQKKDRLRAELGPILKRPNGKKTVGDARADFVRSEP